MAHDWSKICYVRWQTIGSLSRQSFVTYIWLPVPYRIQYKILLLVHRALLGVVPAQLKKLLSFKESGAYNLRSNIANE